MLELEYLAQVEQRYREQVLFPQTGRTARHLRELELQDRKHGAVRRGPKPMRWLGDRLVGVGALIGGLGERLPLRPNGVHRPA